MAEFKRHIENISKRQRHLYKVNQRRKTQRQLVRTILLDYAEHSTLHGLRYIAERGVTSFQKIFWLLTFVVSLFGCGYLIRNVYVKWNTTPVIVSLSEKMISVGAVPFPSVTICPQIKSRATVYSLTEKSLYFRKLEQRLNSDKIMNFTEDRLYKYAEYEDIAMLCRSSYYGLPHYIRSQMKRLNPNETKNIFYKVSPTLRATIRICLWHGNRCHFKRVITEEGVCFNFNSGSAKDLFRNSSELVTNVLDNHRSFRGWNLKTGYNNTEKNPFPFRGTENSAEPDLEVTLAVNDLDKDILCNSHFTGFKIYLHNPLDLPQSSVYYYAAIDNQVTSLAVDLNIMNTSESLIGYRAEVRQCYFPEEKYLKFFKIYTAKNCQMECLANITFKNCKCVGLYMPNYNATTRICKRKDRWCMTQAHEEMINKERNIDWDVPEEMDNNNCRCLPSCFNIEYDAQVLKTNFNGSMELQYATDNLTFNAGDYKSKPIYQRILKQMLDLSKYKYSKVNVYFRKPLFTSMRRSELFGWTDFVANVGGLLSLFLGFSVLSLIEILYFLTVRIGIALRQDINDNH